MYYAEIVGFLISVVNERACASAAPTDLSADEIKAILSVAIISNTSNV